MAEDIPRAPAEGGGGDGRRERKPPPPIEGLCVFIYLSTEREMSADPTFLPDFSPPRAPLSFSVKVDNLSYDTTTDELKGVFEKYGEVADVS